MFIFKKLFDSNEKQLVKLRVSVEEINTRWNELRDISDEEILKKTKYWKEELSKIDDINRQDEYLDKILPEAYALVKEATKRVQNIELHDVQLMAGITLHKGKITEQKTGEGKTNTAVLPLYLNSLTGRGVHLVTPNDYLSRHGAGWMGDLYTALGITVGVIMQERAFIYDPTHENNEFDDAYAVRLREVSRAESYRSDVVYGTNHEFGFDYLRDNLVRSTSEIAQTNPIGETGVHNYAIVDEVDSILIDVARTPLIISTQDAKPSERYYLADSIVKALVKNTDYEVDEKFRNATLTDLGIRRVERQLGVSNLYEDDFEMVHLMEQALVANSVFEKDTDYVVKEGNVIIVDQFTGRLLPNNRYSHGLHQALEAKEKVEIQQESKTLAEISYQNYFRMYRKLAGMTGTALTEAEEFYKIYGLDVVGIPTHKPIARADHNDVIYKSVAGKFKAVADEIEEKYKKGQPVLVGTTSVERSELLHNYLKRKKVPHEILNAKNHEREANIISQAGAKFAVTISTNMAGRGVDIKLGGDPCTPEQYEEIKSLGGLHVIGTERHESRRIDNQLRGRSGRQGDPGSSRFYVSMQDDLMRIFGGAQAERLMDSFGIDDSVPLEAKIVTNSLERAQKKVESFNFDRRKQVVEMDDVINVHRDVVYSLRRKILDLGEGKKEYKDWFMDNIAENSDYDFSIWEENETQVGEDVWISFVKDLSLPVVDLLWMEHLVDMSQVRDGIGLRGYAQRDPMVEYKREGHERFSVLVNRIYSQIAERISKVRISPEESKNVKKDIPRSDLTEVLSRANYAHGSIETGVSEEAALSQGNQSQGKALYEGREIKVQEVKSSVEKVGRNDPCPCGSGKKYKKCHGKEA